MSNKRAGLGLPAPRKPGSRPRLQRPAITLEAPPLHIRLNGEPYDTAANQTVARLIRELNLGARRYAVELNGAIVPRSRHHDTILNPDDRIEIVQAIGGG